MTRYRGNVKNGSDTRVLTANKNTSSNSESENLNNENYSNSTKIDYEDNTDNQQLFSDTPQGSVSRIEDNTYLTNATITTDNKTGSSSNDSDGKVQASNNSKNITAGEEKNNENELKNYRENEDENENEKGFTGITESEMLLKYRETFVNIDKMLIEELEPLFMQIF